jgi:hypothetical protein
MPLTDKGLEAVLAADDWPFERAGDSTWFSAFQRSSGPGDPITSFLRLRRLLELLGLTPHTRDGCRT